MIRSTSSTPIRLGEKALLNTSQEEQDAEECVFACPIDQPFPLYIL